MHSLLDKINLFFEQIPDKMRKRKFIVLGILAILTVVAVLGAGRVRVDMSMESFFKEGEPVKQAYDRFRVSFGSDEIVYVVYKAQDGDVFSEQSLNTIRGIQEELINYRFNLQPGETSPLEHITEVKTLINVKYMDTQEDTLISREFIGENIPQDTQEREHIRKQALAQPDYPLLYFSEDSKYGGFIVKTDFGTTLEWEDEAGKAGQVGGLDDEESLSLDEEEDVAESVLLVEDNAPPKFKPTSMDEYSLFVDALEAVIHKPEYTSVLSFYPVGKPVQMAFSYKAMASEMGMIMGSLLLLVFLMLWLLFRSLSAVIWPVVIIIVSLIWVFGIVGWTGVVMNAMLEIIVFLVLVVGVADSVHILSGYLFFRNHNIPHKDALRSVFKKSGLACFLTSLTTAIGLTALIFVPIVSIRDFGIFAAIGVFIAFLLTILLLPIMLDLWNPISKKRARRIAESEAQLHILQKLLRKIELFSYNRPKTVFILSLVIAIVLVIGALNIQVDTNSIEAIKERAPIRKAYSLVDQFMGGTGGFEVLIDTGSIDGMKDPQVLQAMETLQRRIEAQHDKYVVKTVSLVNVTKDSYKALNEGREDMYVLPQDPDVLAQTLFLFNNANPKDRRQLVSDDYRIGRISATTKNVGSKIGLGLMENVDGLISELFAPLKGNYPDLDVTVTGQIPLSNRLSDYISWSQIKSFGITLVVISILLLIVLGSMRIGVIAIIPNLFPILAIFGLMGYLKIPLEIHLLLVAPITIGIAVDDTIHFLTHYRLEMKQNDNIQEAIRNTFREVGQAIVFTSLILSIGFLSYLLSVSMGFVYFGIFSGIAMLVALLADLFLLPAMLVLFRSRKDQA